MKDASLIIEPHYWGNYTYFKTLTSFSRIIIEHHLFYRKRCFTNRCQILGPNGVQTLSVPLIKGKHSQLPLNEVKISYAEDWITNHLRSLATAYGSSPFYSHYIEEIRAIYSLEFDFLRELLDKIFKWVQENFFENAWIIQYSNSYSTTLDEIVDSRNQIHLRSSRHPQQSYPQVYEYKFGFIQNLSILDLIFNVGPNLKNHF